MQEHKYFEWTQTFRINTNISKEHKYFEYPEFRMLNFVIYIIFCKRILTVLIISSGIIVRVIIIII
jgi:hypothetical protein